MKNNVTMVTMFWILLLIGIFFALNSTEASNKTFVLNITNNTYFINDSNTTFMIVLQNTSVQLNFSQNYTTINNLTVVSPPMNINQTLAAGGNYTNTSNGAFIFVSCEAWTNTSCPTGPSCLQNISRSLAYRERFYNSACNISIDAPDREYLNVTQTLNYSGRYANQIYGIYIDAPPQCSAPLYNITWNMSYGGSQMHSATNISASCPKFPSIDLIENLMANQSKGFNIYNLTVNCAPCKEGYNYIPRTLNCTTNHTYSLDNNLTVNYCADDLRNICSADELLDHNLKGCFVRSMEKLDSERKLYENRSATLEIDLREANNIKKSLLDSNSFISANLSEILMAIVLVVGGMFAGVGLISYYMRKSKEKERGIQ